MAFKRHEGFSGSVPQKFIELLLTVQFVEEVISLGVRYENDIRY